MLALFTWDNSSVEFNLLYQDAFSHCQPHCSYRGTLGKYFYNDHLSGHNSSVGFVPGLKLTYKKRFNSWLVGEPYVGVSAPWHDSNFKELFNWISHSDPGLVITFGIRIGFNKVRFGTN